jgi:CCR4-NOT transcription complex subunit 7/8
MREPLPGDESAFFELIRSFFPCIYDIKYLAKSCKNLRGGLNDVSDTLGVKRVGPQHQAGSDSLLTGTSFFKMRELHFDGCIDNNKYQGVLYGLNVPYQNAVSFHNNTNTNHDDDIGYMQ